MFGRFRPGRKVTNIGAPNVRAISARPKSHEHWGPQCSGDSGQSDPQCSCLFGLAEIAPTLGGVWPESPEHWGGFGRNRPNIGGVLAEIARTLGAPMFVAFRPGRNRPNIGGGLAGIARTLGGVWPKSPEHWGGFGRNRPNTGGPNVRGFSAWPKSPQHWGGFGRNRPNIGGGLAEIARTLGGSLAEIGRRFKYIYDREGLGFGV